MVGLSQFPSPCYTMEEELLRRSLYLIKSVVGKAGVEIILAFKSFTMWHSLPVLREYIDYSMASPVYEACLALEGFGSKAHTYSPAYTEQDFPEIMRRSNHITFNSMQQFGRFYPTVVAEGSGTSCGIRANPEYSEVETEFYNPCTPGIRLGITADLLPDTLSQGIEDFHRHCYCESPPHELEHILEHPEARFAHWLPQTKWSNLGGGRLIIRKDCDTKHLIRLLQGLKACHPHLRIIPEPGLAFTWQTGVLTSEAVDIMESRDTKMAILNASLTYHIPDCLKMPYQPAIRGAEVGSEGKYTYRLGESSCLSGDYMGLWNFDHKLQIGERTMSEDIIYYTIVKINMFNGIRHPAIATQTKEGKAKIYKQFSYKDYRDRMS